MILGVFIGHAREATEWVFAAAAGMFLYIALVDMVCITAITIHCPPYGFPLLAYIKNYCRFFNFVTNHNIMVTPIPYIPG